MPYDGNFWLINVFQQKAEENKIINVSTNGNDNLKYNLKRIMITKNHSG